MLAKFEKRAYVGSEKVWVASTETCRIYPTGTWSMK